MIWLKWSNIFPNNLFFRVIVNEWKNKEKITEILCVFSSYLGDYRLLVEQKQKYYSPTWTVLAPVVESVVSTLAQEVISATLGSLAQSAARLTANAGDTSSNPSLAT